MAAYLMCVTVSGGVPIFNRKFGDIKSVSETYRVGYKGHDSGVEM